MTKNFMTVNVKKLNSKSKNSNDLGMKTRPAPVLSVTINSGIQRRITFSPNSKQRKMISKRLSTSFRSDKSATSSGKTSKDKMKSLILDRVKEDKDELLGSNKKRIE